MEKETKIVAKTKSQLAAEYGISVKTLNKWIKPFQDEINSSSSRIFTPNQVIIIYEKIGYP